MAEQCTPIAIILDDGATSINYCWEDGFIEPGWAAKNVVMGLRKSWQTCQYFIKGLYPKCTSWNEEAGKCTFADNQKTDIPSGYNSSKCDFLGRRSWCTKYAPSGDVVAEEPKYFCIAPNPYLSGLGKGVEGQPSLRVAIPNTEIKGYNKGQCDCYGMGKGEAGCGIGSTYAGTQNAKAEEELAKLPCVCNYYRPFQMGFGAQSPHEIRKLDGTLDIEAMKKLVATGVEMETRLPLSFVVYNYRANTQKCQWYEKDAGSNFILNTNSEIDLEDGGAVTYCKCTDSAANPFKTKSNKTGFRLEKVWAEGDTILCNGAKPECPSYTGKWTYCKDDRMRPGMPISAQQVFELRFWANDWETQEQYDKAYQLKPNPQDKPTAAIFTFDKWKGATTKAEDNVLTGFKVEMCQPAPAHNKVFEPSLYLKTTSVNFSDAFVNKGSTSSNAPLFPSLIRIPDFSLTAPLQVVYPYVDDDVFDAEVCKVRSSSSSSGMIKRTNDYRGDYIHVVGYTMRNREVFVINTSGPDGSPTTIRSYDSMLAVPRSEKSNVTKSLVDYINQLTRKGNEYIVRGVSSDFGGFLISPLKLVWGDNNILICVDFGDGTWEFKKRKVVSKWYGAVVIQTEFKQTYDTKNKEGYEYSYNKPDPKGTAKAKIITLSPNISLHSIVPTSRVDDIKKNTLTYNYAIVEKTESDKVVTKWAPVGQSEYVWAEVEDLELNYLLPREVVSAKMVGKGKTLELEENTSLYTNYLQPNVFIFSITNFKDNRQVFNPKDWTLTITYKFQKIVSHDAVGDGTVIFPTDGSLGSIPVDLSITSGFINFKSVYQTTMSFMALFKDEKGKVISSFATKLLNSMCKVECRSVEMWYSYHADAFNYTLVPEWGKCVNVKGAARLAGGGFSCGGASSHATKGPCGDHDIKMSSGLGPVWFPFNECETYFKYNKPQPQPIYPGIGYCSSCHVCHSRAHQYVS